MQYNPSIELLESMHEFPGPFMMKVIGSVEDAFVARVVAAVRDELHANVDPRFRLRYTSGGRHVAITLEPIVKSAEQVLEVYRRIRETRGVILLL